MTGIPNSLAARDIASLIHPYTNLEKHKADGPVIMARGEGVYVYDEAGKRYLEGMTRLVWAAEALCTATGLELPQEGVGEVSPGIAIEGLGIPTSEHESLLMEVGAIGERARHFLS